MRTLSIGRANSKWLLNSMGFPQTQDSHTKEIIALYFRAVSLQDNYWIKGINEDISWNDVNLRTNAFNNYITYTALHGGGFYVNGHTCTPEFTTQGSYPKAWKHDDDGLYLYKTGSKMGEKFDKESHVEIEVSHLLDKFNIPHVKYLPAKSKGVFCCKCECMTSEEYSILPALDFYIFCRNNNKDFMTEIFRYEPTLIYQMLIIDYLFSNSDRHLKNWGFYYDCDTMEIKGCHPLFDHNRAFDKELLFSETGGESQLFTDMTMLDAAKLGVSKLDFKLPKDISISDFDDFRHYKSFKFKAQNLGLLPKKKPFGFINK